eukprot:TRINITY_DN71610_c0_g1_i1.p1 TRINITY_DN71610_c0_g1~~TRINITY_DN71610_c0_g1_i1.p1  ORF type:complete len:561 (+),score=178.07 TRINITY_DN71610_c0_g1_i1:108-1790(+)
MNGSGCLLSPGSGTEAGRRCGVLRGLCAELEAATRHADSDISSARAKGNETALCGALSDKVQHMRAVAAACGQALRDAVQAVRDTVQDDDQALAELAAEVPALREQVRQALTQLEAAREEAQGAERRKQTAEREVRQAEARAARAQRESSAAAVPPRGFQVTADLGGLFGRYTEQRCRVRTAAERISIRLRRYFAMVVAPAEGGAAQLQSLSGAEFEKLSAEAEQMETVEATGLAADLSRLRELHDELGQAGVPPGTCDIAEEEGFCAEVERAAAQWKETLATDAARRSRASEQSTRFSEDAARLLQWARQEGGNLHALEKPQHVQEFCDSLAENTPQMEANLQILCDSAETLPPGASGEGELSAVGEVWNSLQLQAFERNLRAVVEVHPHFTLEDEVRRLSDYQQRLADWAAGSPDSAAETLTALTDPAARKAAAPVAADCKKLKAELQVHSKITEQLQCFADRQEALRDSYAQLRRGVCSRLTYLPSDSGSGCGASAEAAAVRRRREYAEHVGEIREWVRHHSRGPQWKELRGAAERLRALCEEEAARHSAPEGEPPQ